MKKFWRISNKMEEEEILMIKNIFEMNSYEYKIWNVLLEHKDIIISDIHSLSGVPRSRCYDTVESLMNKELIVFSDTYNRKQKFKANNPEVIIEKIKNELLKKTKERLGVIDKFCRGDAFMKLKLLYADKEGGSQNEMDLQ